MRTFVGQARLISGIALIGVGVLTFHENLGRTASQLSALGTIHGESLSLMPSMILTTWRVCQAYVADQQEFMRRFLQDILLLSWPLLLIAAGTSLLLNRDPRHVGGLCHLNPKSNARNKYCGSVDMSIYGSTLR
jgi:hypothetical protein